MLVRSLSLLLFKQSFLISLVLKVEAGMRVRSWWLRSQVSERGMARRSLSFLGDLDFERI